MKVIVFEEVDGLVAITKPSSIGMAAVIADPNSPILTEDEFIAQLQARKLATHPTRIARGVVDDSTFPDNAGLAMEYILDESSETVTQIAFPDQIRCFRDSWVWDGLTVVEDPAKRGDIKKERARNIRGKLLELSDKDEMRLLAGGGQDLIDIRTYRTSLRDLGAAIDSDPDSLVWPTKP